MEDRGYVILESKKLNRQYQAVVLVLQINDTYQLCPVWKEEVNKLVPIMRATKDNAYGILEGKCYIDIGDPFAYELCVHKTLVDRINDFNEEQIARDNPEVKIIKIATVADLQRAKLPYYIEGEPCEPIQIVK